VDPGITVGVISARVCPTSALSQYSTCTNPGVRSYGAVITRISRLRPTVYSTIGSPRSAVPPPAEYQDFDYLEWPLPPSMAPAALGHPWPSDRTPH
jgi:hypothetical protein